MSIFSLLFGKSIRQNDELLIQSRAPIRSIPEFLSQTLTRKVSGNHVYLEGGAGKALIFCHGLFGGIFNIDHVSQEISKRYRFLMPYLPMYDQALSDCTIDKLGDYLHDFIRQLGLKEAVVIGSSMGGGTALYGATKPGHKIKGMVLCGSSGLSNIPLSKGYFKRKEFAFVKEATRDIFYNRSVPSDDMIRDVFAAIQDYEVVLRSIRFTKAAGKNKMHSELPTIKVPTLLIWGSHDPITPPEVAYEFLELMPHAELHYINECGHVPTQEKPEEFLNHLDNFLQKIRY